MGRYRSDEDRVGGMVWGIGLVLMGSVILLQYLGLMPFAWWHSWWPLLIVGVGIAQIVTRPTPKRIGDGVSTMLFGGWFFIAANDVWGLSWRNSWPLALVAAGMGMVVRSIAAGSRRRDDDVREVRIDG